MLPSLFLLPMVLVTSVSPATPSLIQQSTESPKRDWAQWRGPDFNGSAVASGLPTDFDKKKQVEWVSELPGVGASTPIVVGTRIFLTSVDQSAGTLLALCLDRESGELLWQKQAGSGYQPGGQGSKTGIHNRSNYASPSAVCDGQRVIFFFGNGLHVAYDMFWNKHGSKKAPPA